MGRHLAKLQAEEAELFAAILTRHLVKAAVELINAWRTGSSGSPEPVDDDTPVDEAEVMRRADALVGRLSRR